MVKILTVKDMSDHEGEPPHKIPRVLKEKDRSKRLIIILEHASLETVKVRKPRYLIGLSMK